MMSEFAIDPATVQRCIEVLRGKGEHEYRRVPYSRDREECWIYATHPIDLLQALLPEPEKSEAEKLVDEWQGLRQYDWFNRDDTEEQVSLVQFVLDKVNTSLTFPSTEGVEVTTTNSAEALYDIQFGDANMKSTPIIPTTGDAATVNTADPTTTDSQPQYVFGPWIEWHGGKCPVPDDWEVQWLTCHETTERFNPVVLRAEDLNWKRDHGALTHYRVRFKVGKWYSWAGGPCPVLPEQWVNIVCADGYKTSDVARRFCKSDSHEYNWWTGECLKGGERNDQIVKFRCIDVAE